MCFVIFNKQYDDFNIKYSHREKKTEEYEENEKEVEDQTSSKPCKRFKS